jgi:catechol 2,3-dioxygenase-like lactoylglutathione lyase family enzyme
MRLNQVTVSMPDLDQGWQFYTTLGLKPIVDNRPHYARFLCPAGDSTFSIVQGPGAGKGTYIYFECEDIDEKVAELRGKGIDIVSEPEDKEWLWREAELNDPGGNNVVLFQPGDNRINPPWRVPDDYGG